MLSARVKGLIRAAAAKAGIGVFRVRDRYSQDGLFTVHSDAFRSDPEFRAAYARGVQSSQGVDPQIEWRVHIALWAAQMGLHAEGDFVECGVNAGFISSAIMHGLHWNRVGRRFYLIDTFAGPVENLYSQEEVRDGRLALAKQALQAGAYVTDMDRVRSNFAEWQNAVVVQGPVPEVLGRVGADAVAFLHIDMNCGRPERDAFEYFWGRLSPHGIVLLDDYGYLGHNHQREAIDASASERGASILALPTGQGLIMK
jgi:hypothetical protein